MNNEFEKGLAAGVREIRNWGRDLAREAAENVGPDGAPLKGGVLCLPACREPEFKRGFLTACDMAEKWGVR